MEQPLLIVLDVNYFKTLSPEKFGHLMKVLQILSCQFLAQDFCGSAEQFRLLERCVSVVDFALASLAVLSPTYDLQTFVINDLSRLPSSADGLDSALVGVGKVEKSTDSMLVDGQVLDWLDSDSLDASDAKRERALRRVKAYRDLAAPLSPCSDVSTISRPCTRSSVRVIEKEFPPTPKANKKLNTKVIIRRLKYRMNKMYQLQKKKIDELKTINERQRKQLYRLKHQSAALRKYEPTSKTNTEDMKQQSESDAIKTIKNNIEEDIKTFLEEDENSRIITKTINDSGIYEKDLLIPSDLKQFAGTMKVHQAVWNANEPNQLSMRKMSCAEGECKNNSASCEHGHHVGLYIIGEQTNRLLTDKSNKNKSDKIDLIKKSSQALKCSGVGAAKSKKPQILSNILIQPGSSYHIDLADECSETKQRLSHTLTSDIGLHESDSFWTRVSTDCENIAPAVMNEVFSKIVDSKESTEENIEPATSARLEMLSSPTSIVLTSPDRLEEYSSPILELLENLPPFKSSDYVSDSSEDGTLIVAGGKKMRLPNGKSRRTKLNDQYLYHALMTIHLSDANLKEGIFTGPDVRKLIKDTEFAKVMTNLERNALKMSYLSF
ncbi:unnamed protein product [Arctia plantaginis]|uniref:Uncharacterized protein n=1 Tax=Arctia plantaginis TaxID=874455 RepID=A0A8S0ZI12_ARCPL|nr:unnamed protein product [Arctia plantaginis]